MKSSGFRFLFDDDGNDNNAEKEEENYKQCRMSKYDEFISNEKARKSQS